MKDEQKEEAKRIINKYPKQALKGMEIELDAEWKKAMVSVFAFAKINIKLSTMQLNLANQISEAFDNSLKEMSKMELNEPNISQLRITFRIKNLLLSSSDVIKPAVIELNQIIMPSKELIYPDLFLYYVGAKSGIIGELDEARKVAYEIDPSLARCFQEAIQNGANLEDIEKETLDGINTREDIKGYMQTIYRSVGLLKQV